MKALKATISGSYVGADREIFDFSNLSGTLPYQAEDIATMHIRGRYALMWITKSEAHKARVMSIRECYIDELVEVDAKFSFVGKNIQEMTREELQDLATAKDLRGIPLFRTSERDMREKAYIAYCDKILDQDVMHKTLVRDGNRQTEILVKPGDIGFNFMKLNPIIVGNAENREEEAKPDNEAILARGALAGDENEPETPAHVSHARRRR